MLLKLLRFLRGSVDLSVNGTYPERFINVTNRNRVRLWNVRRRGEGFSVSMYRSDYRRIRPLAKGANVRLKLENKRGLPTFVFRYRQRIGVLIGACTFIVAVFVMSMFIWSIDITGLESVSQTQMQAILRDHGLYIGAFKPGLNVQKIARDILIERHEIGWMAINMTGSYASVEVKEESPPPGVEDVDLPCNIKAKCDGLLLRIEAREGTSTLTEGSGVIEGQLLVSGVIEDADGTSRLVHADARILARTTRQASFSLSKNVTTLRPTGETAHRKSLDLLGLKLPFSFDAVDSPYSVTESQTLSPSPLDIALPIGMTDETVRAMAYEERTLDENSAKELLEREAALYEAFTLQNCAVESRDLRLEEHDGGYTLYATYTCVEDIAVSEPIGIDENTNMTRYVAPTEKPE